MRTLLPDQPIFVGFKLETGLRRQVESLGGPDRKYISADESMFLRLCKLGDETWVGKLIEEPLTTDRIDDLQRNVLSIMQRLFPDTRMPKEMRIFACGGEALDAPPPMPESSARRDW